MKKKTIVILLVVILILTITLNWGHFYKFIRYYPNYNPFNPVKLDIKPLEITQVSSNSSNSKSKTFELSTLYSSQIPFNGTTRKILIYLPKGYDNTPLPLLVLLHGSPGKETDWLEAGKAKATLDNLISNKAIAPLIVAFPDGNGGEGRDTQFINSADSKELNEDLIAKQIVEFCQGRFSTKSSPESRAIGGLSSGGFGALNIGLKHQDIFGYIVMFSGYGDVEQNNLSNELIQNNKATIYNNSPNQYISTLKSKNSRIWMTVGNQDAEFYPLNQSLYKTLKNNRFDVTFNSKDGFHSWDLWSSSLSEALIWLNLK